jgi:hypothetical protein
MRKIRITLKTAKYLDYGFWSIAVLFSFWADWRMGVALMAFDVMRVFEDFQKIHKYNAIGDLLEKRIVDAVIKAKE